MGVVFQTEKNIIMTTVQKKNIFNVFSKIIWVTIWNFETKSPTKKNLQ